MTSNLLCTACRVEVKGEDGLKTHYKSDFHRYNIKRNLVQLPPVSLEVYKEKKAQILEKKDEKQETLSCKTCKKKFSSKNTYQQHLASNKHLDAEKEEKSSTKSAEISLEGGISYDKSSTNKERTTTAEDPTVCLFCNLKSEDVNESLLHMRIAHSFFISEPKYCTKVPELLSYLGEKIHLGCLCIYCENNKAKDFKTGYAVQSHMMDKGHCFMKTEDFTEYSRFYNFSSTHDNHKLKEIGADELSKLKRNEGVLEVESDDGGDGEEEDEEWVDDEEEGVEGETSQNDSKALNPNNSENEGAIQVVGNNEEMKEDTRAAFRKKKRELKVRRYVVPKIEVLESGDIRLANGNIIGHRMYKNLYKQHFRERPRVRLERLGLTYHAEKQLALMNHQNQLALYHNLALVKERNKNQKTNYRTIYRNKLIFMKLGIRGNKTLQHHFIQATP